MSASHIDVFLFNYGGVGVYHSYGGMQIIDSVCEFIEDGRELERVEEPIADCFAEGAAIIDPGQKKAWLYSSHFEWKFHAEQHKRCSCCGQPKPNYKPGNTLELRNQSDVPRGWTFIIVKRYRDIYDILKNCNQWPWKEPDWNEFRDLEEDGEKD